MVGSIFVMATSKVGALHSIRVTVWSCSSVLSTRSIATPLPCGLLNRREKRNGSSPAPSYYRIVKHSRSVRVLVL